MQKRLGLLLIGLMVVLLVACDAPGVQTGGPIAQNSPGAPAGSTPGGQRPGGTPGGQRPGGTPGGQRPSGQPGGTPGAQQTPRAQATPTSDANRPVAPTAVLAGIITGTNSSDVPTAVPVPVIVFPTELPQAAPASGQPTAVPSLYTPIPIPTAAPLPTGAQQATMDSLRGKIIFFSDRAGGYAQMYQMNPDGSNPQLCYCSDLLQGIVNTEVTSPDKQQYLYVTTVGSARNGDIQIWRHNNKDNTDEPVTGGAPGFPGVDYGPVWSPDSRHVAFVTEVNKYDEIFLYDFVENSTVRLTTSSLEWYKHPSFSPDGSQITYWTNKEDASIKQIWVMNMDGSGQHNISKNHFNDWDPIWAK